MTTSKTLLANYDKAVCRQHFIWVGGVISLMLTIAATIFAAPRWYFYLPVAYCLLVTTIAIFSTCVRRIRLVVLTSALMLIEIIGKLIFIVVLIHQRIEIYRTCYQQMDKCEYNEWRTELIDTTNALSFLIISDGINLFNFISTIYLIYLFRNNRMSNV